MPEAHNVNPVMIKWARQDCGFSLDELPDYLKDAEKWETGEKLPTWTDLRNMAKKYKRPSFFYFLSKPPIDNIDFIDFRSDEKIGEFSPELRLEIRKAKSRRNAYIRIHEDMGIPIPNFKKHLCNEKNPIKLGQYIRQYLNVDFETQKKWILNNNGNHESFLERWIEVCFDLGILVFETNSVLESEISGCSIYYDYCPIILLNGKNYHNRRIFTLMHELAHLIQGTSAICDVDKHNKKEAFCNNVASEILMPDDTFKNLQLNKHELKVTGLSDIYGVSKQSIIYKLNHSGFIDDGLKNEWILKLERDNEIMRRKDGERKNSEPRISTISLKKQNGEPYTRLILDAYDNNIITSTQAMRYLDTSLDKIKSWRL